MKTGGRGAIGDKQGFLDIIAALTLIYEAVDGLEMSVDSIDMSNAAIDMNTDELEERIGDLAETPIVNSLQDRLRLLLIELAAVRAITDQMVFTGDDLNVILPDGFATEATLEAARALLELLKDKDFATETTLDAIKVLLTSLDDGDIATEAKQDIQITNQGTDGATPPVIAGTGIRGWLRAIYDQLIGGISTTTTFFKNAVPTIVSLDTVTPANSEPLPTTMYNDLGAQGTSINPFGIASFDAFTATSQIIDLNGAAKVGQATILAGDVLYGQPLSALLWRTLLINGGTLVGGAGEQLLQTNTTANGEVILQSFKRSRFMISQFNISHFGIQLSAALLADPNTICEWGSVDFIDTAGALNVSANGLFFRVTGGVTPVWAAVSIKNGVETAVDSSLWNGINAGLLNKTPDLSVYEIRYNAGTAFFFQGANFMHRIAGLVTTYAATYNFPVALRIRNINGNTTNRILSSRAAGSYRLGQERGEVISRAFTSDTLIKAGAGFVDSVTLARNGSAGGAGVATIYDGVDATGILMSRIDVGGDATVSDNISATYQTGLFVAISGSGVNTLTVKFE